MRELRVLALDLDGTLATSDRVDPEVLAALDGGRARGLRLVLVTGRITGELAVRFPGLTARFDAVVTENGGVLHMPGHHRLLTVPVPVALEEALADRGVQVRRGETLLACAAADAGTALAVVDELGLEIQLVRNREALMLLSAGVSKGSGLAAAVEALGLTLHETVAVGDAENDHSLLDAAEFAVAVANAVPAVRAHADHVTAAADGRGVIEVLGRLEPGAGPLHSRRRRVVLGEDSDGRPVGIPASQTNLLVVGDTGCGKSTVLGLVAEHLLDAGYSCLVVDGEGDHVVLGSLPGVHVVRVADRGQAGLVLRRTFPAEGGLVADLSMLAVPDRRQVARDLLAAAAESRARRARPHWVLVDEAQDLLPAVQVGAGSGVQHGLAAATWDPDGLPSELEAAFEYELVMGAGPSDPMTLRHRPTELVTTLVPATRRTAHVRHWHKYVEGQLPGYRRFWFRDDAGATGRTAGNLRELATEVAGAGADVLRHHARGHDLSRWLRDVVQDEVLAELVADLEERVIAGAGPEVLGDGLPEALRRRYGPTVAGTGGGPQGAGTGGSGGGPQGAGGDGPVAHPDGTS